MTKKVVSPAAATAAPVNNKELNAAHIFKLTIRDRDHFYKIVNWLNSNLGKGEEYWTMEGRVLKTLKQGKPATPRVYIFKQEFDESASLYLSLL
jgi:hypothetical protein